MIDITKLVGDESPLELGLKINEIIEQGGGGGLEIGDIGIAPLGLDESQNKRRYINGQLILQDQFVSFTNKVKKAVELYPNLACTEEQWQATVTMSAFGQCGKFVIDDEAGTIRLPKITGFIQGLTDLASLGELVGAGLPNIVGQVSNVYGGGTTGLSGWGVFTPSLNTTHGAFNSGTQYNSGSTITFDASKSNATYGKLNTVQPESIRYPYFIQVATGVEESVDVTREIELNNPYSLGDSKYSPVALDNISWLKSEGQWNSKAVYPDYYDWILANANNGVADFKLSTDTYDDYSWVVNTADETFRLPLLNGSEDLPSGRIINLTLGTSGSTYTAPANGILTLRKRSNSTNSEYVAIENRETGECVKFQTPNSTTDCPVSMEFKRNQIATYYYTTSGVTNIFNFQYATGNGSLYFYVGETVQNANLINAGRIEENVASIKSSVDAILGGSQNPDYSRAIQIPNGYTCPSDGYAVTRTVVLNTSESSDFKINNLSVSFTQNTGGAIRWGGGMYKVSKGDYLSWAYWNEVYFIPEKGV